MNIVLIGMRGTGKTSIGKNLAAKTERQFFETDDIIEKQEGTSIQQLVREKGWEYFRDIESKVVAEVAAKNHAVVATGGGVILRIENTKSLKRNGILFLLTADIDTMLKRIGDDPNRPSLTGRTSRREDIEETLRRRDVLYRDAADETIDTSMQSEKELAEKIAHIFKEKYAN